MPFCTQCGLALAGGNRFCGHCGHRVSREIDDSLLQASEIESSLAQLDSHEVSADSAEKESALNCPKCGLFSPASATRCDCGYEFSTGKIVSSKKVATAAPSGVGGWLALLTFGLLVLGPLLGAGRVNVDFMSAEEQNPALKTVVQWANFKTATWSAFWGFSAISAYAGWGLMRGQSWSVVRRARVALWVIGPVANVVLGLAVPIITLGSTQGFDGGQLVAPFIGAFVSSLIVAAVWTAYLSKSKRVRTTYRIGAEA